MPFSIQEKANMILIYGEARRNSTAAALLYEERFPGAICPSRRTFEILWQKLYTTGNLTTRKSERSKRATGEENENVVLAALQRDVHISSRQIQRESGISQRSVLRIIHRHKFHPYHISLHQALHGNDFANRVAFCQWAQEKVRMNPDFFSYLLFTDEATFTNHGNVNLHNMHYWSVENPHWLRQVDNQRQWSLNVWCGIIGNNIVGPYFFDGVLNGEKYTTFLVNILWELLDDIPLNVRRNMWFQQDGCPAHFALTARRELNRLYPERWIGRGGPVLWPPRSPDLTPLDFFLWGTLKDKVYKEPPTTIENMRQRIIDASAEISPETLQLVQEASIRRLQLCIDQNGQHFEHLIRK